MADYLNPKLPALWHGGDYSPEQWSPEVWDEDVRLMQEARFRVATLGVFSWVALEPEEGRFEFGWLDAAIEKLAAADRYFILATPSAAAPAWLSKQYPETLRTGPDGVRRRHGNRVNYNLASATYREKTRDIARRLAERYGAHPRLLAWHVSNEYGGVPDYGPESVEAFRSWLRKKFANDLDALNRAYWTPFWSHTYTDWAQIEPPGEPYGETAIQGLTVDWRRYTTDATVEFMLNEAAPLREISPEVPITTNLMGAYNGLDYRKLAPHLDFVSWDSYPDFGKEPMGVDDWVATSFKHDLMRSLRADRPWLLMEMAPGPSNWQPFMSPKRPGVHKFESLQAVAHGADGVQYFQWRASRGSQEQFHAAIVGHNGGEKARMFGEVAEVGRALVAMDGVVGKRPQNEVAVVFDWPCRWALDAACGPVQGDKRYVETATEHYAAFWRSSIGVDLVGMDDDLSRYKLLIAPMAYSVTGGFAERVGAFVADGGTMLTTYLSGWVDENGLVFEGGFLAPWREMLGIWSEELDVLRGTTVPLSGGKAAREFCELIHLDGAEAIETYAGEFYAGRPSFTVNRHGEGKAYYVASRNDREFLDLWLPLLAKKAGVKPAYEGGLAKGLSAQRRGDRVFVLNPTDELKTFAHKGASHEIGPYGVVLL